MLQWAREERLPSYLNYDILSYAMYAGHLTVSLWLLGKGCPSIPEDRVSLRSLVASMTLSYLVLRTAAPAGIPSELLRDMVMAAHRVD